MIMSSTLGTVRYRSYLPYGIQNADLLRSSNRKQDMTSKSSDKYPSTMTAGLGIDAGENSCLATQTHGFK